MFETKLPYDWENASAVDLDGTLCAHCYPDPPGRPYTDVINALRYRKKQGRYIIIHSCRMTPPNNLEEQRKLIFSFLVNNDVPFDMIWDGKGKPIAAEYIDDRAKTPSEFVWEVMTASEKGWEDKE